MAKITYANKTTLNPQPSIADENKVTAGDMNEIKSVVNGLIVNSYSTDDEKTYGCDYINNLYGITDGVPFKTGGKYQNKDIYRLVKNLGYLPSGVLADRAIAIGITNFTPITAPKIMYFGYLSNIQKWRYFQNPFLGSTNINSFIEENNVIVTTGADRSSFQLVLDVTFVYND